MPNMLSITTPTRRKLRIAIVAAAAAVAAATCSVSSTRAIADPAGASTEFIAPTGSIASFQANSIPPTSPPKVVSARIWVSPKGRDDAPGSKSRPKLTLTAAIAKLPVSGSAIIYLAPGNYPPTTINRANTTVTSVVGSSAIFTGAAGAPNVILIKASHVTLSNVTVANCIPVANPSGSYEDDGSAGVRVDDGVTSDVIDSVTVRDSTGVNSEGLPFGCYGVFLHNSWQTTVKNSNLYNNGYGIFVIGGGGHTLKGNEIHDNRVVVRNTRTGSDDFGAVGIGFGSSTLRSVASHNTIWNNSGPSADWGTDGGAFEIFQSSNVVMSENVLHDNENILETGAGRTGNCINNQFLDNTVTGRTAGSSLARSAGMILRCANKMVISGNHITDVDWWTFWAYQAVGTGDIVGLAITGNYITQGFDKVYALTSNLSGLKIRIQKNAYAYRGTFWTDWNNRAQSFADWRSRMGFDNS